MVIMTVVGRSFRWDGRDSVMERTQFNERSFKNAFILNERIKYSHLLHISTFYRITRPMKILPICQPCITFSNPRTETMLSTDTIPLSGSFRRGNVTLSDIIILLLLFLIGVCLYPDIVLECDWALSCGC